MTSFMKLHDRWILTSIYCSKWKIARHTIFSNLCLNYADWADNRLSICAVAGDRKCVWFQQLGWSYISKCFVPLHQISARTWAGFENQCQFGRRLLKPNCVDRSYYGWYCIWLFSLCVYNYQMSLCVGVAGAAYGYTRIPFRWRASLKTNSLPDAIEQLVHTAMLKTVRSLSCWCKTANTEAMLYVQGCENKKDKFQSNTNMYHNVFLCLCVSYFLQSKVLKEMWWH